MNIIKLVKTTNKFVKMQEDREPELKKKNFGHKVKNWMRWMNVVAMFGGSSYVEIQTGK